MLLAAARPCPFTWQTQSRCLQGRCTDVASWRRGRLCCRGWSPGFLHTATPGTRSLNTSENNCVFYGFVSRPEPHTLFTVRFLHFLYLHGCCLNGRTYKTSIRRTDAILSHSAFSREAWIILFIPHNLPTAFRAKHEGETNVVFSSSSFLNEICCVQCGSLPSVQAINTFPLTL